MDKIDLVLRKLQKKYDNGVIMDLRKQSTLPKCERVPVDSPKIGEVLGFGGYPRGKVVIIYGAESSGKTSLCSYLAGTCQRSTFETIKSDGEIEERKGMVLFIDTEHAFDPEYAKTQGFDISKCILVQPDNGEQALDIALQFIESGSVDMVILDSLASCTPQAEIEADMDQMQMGLQARMFGKFFRKAVAMVDQSKCTLVCTNQVRDNFGYGSPDVMPGGRAIKFYSSISIQVKRKEYIMDGNDTVGIKIQLKSVKNKTAPPMKTNIVSMSFKNGFESRLDWVDYAIKYDVIKNPSSGTFLSYRGEKIRAIARVHAYYAMPEHAEEYDEVIEETKTRMYQGLENARVSADNPEDKKEAERLLSEEEKETQNEETETSSENE